MKLTAQLNWWLEAWLGFFYPPVCQCCRAEPAAAEAGYVGASCQGQVRRVREPFCVRCGLPYEGRINQVFECSNCRSLDLHFDWARSAVLATGPVLEVIHRYKYGRELWFEPFLAGLLVAAAAPVLRSEGWDLIVPVPLHPLKERDREFNQACRLARCLSRATGVPSKERALHRTHFTSTQTRLSRSERLVNVRGAFVADRVDAIRGRRVIVIDDVLTTGATTSEVARVLKECGAAAVGVWTVARGLGNHLGTRRPGFISN